MVGNKRGEDFNSLTITDIIDSEGHEVIDSGTRMALNEHISAHNKRR